MKKENAIKINIGIFVLLLVVFIYFATEVDIYVSNNVVAGNIWSSRYYGLGDLVATIICGIGLVIQFKYFIKYTFNRIN
ncbi:MAG: hypothetical protein KQ78_01188 [Candidatus Izimaplasma bacterium HR2]|nr:MAG: hypothetical protein KQ78_01188 [Candidatus Izimaplasma bacterium HR2]